MSIEEKAGSVTVTATGLSDLQNHVASVTASVPGGPLEIVQTPSTVYEKVPQAAAAKLGVTTPWASIDRKKAESAIVGATGGTDTDEGSNLLAVLGAASETGVKKLNSETVRGASTTHYQATIDVAKAVTNNAQVTNLAEFQKFVQQLGSKTATVDVWVDHNKVVHRITTNRQVQGVTATATVEFYDFGKAPSPAVPAARDVTDITDKVIAQAQQRQQAQPPAPS